MYCTECTSDTTGTSYQGRKSSTRAPNLNNRVVQCLAWTNNFNGRSYRDGDFYNNERLSDVSNYCRQTKIDNSRTRPWCYYDTNGAWAYCDVPNCCKLCITQ